MRKLSCVVLIISFSAAGAGLAQDASWPTLRLTIDGEKAATCADFSKAPGGLWSTNGKMVIVVPDDTQPSGGLGMPPGKSLFSSPVQFFPGVSMNGVDVAAELDQMCK